MIVLGRQPGTLAMSNLIRFGMPSLPRAGLELEGLAVQVDLIPELLTALKEAAVVVASKTETCP
jgi:hypothetical protein